MKKLYSVFRALTSDGDRQFTPFEFDPVQFLQNDVGAFVGHVHQGLAIEDLNPPHDFLRYSRDSRNHTDKIARRNLMGIAHIESEPDHALFM